MREDLLDSWRVAVISRRVEYDKLLKVEVDVLLTVVVVAVELCVVVDILDQQHDADFELLALLQRLIAHLAFVDSSHGRLAEISGLKDLLIDVAEGVLGDIGPVGRKNLPACRHAQ